MESVLIVEGKLFDIPTLLGSLSRIQHTKWTRFVGAGALIAALLAAGYSVDEITSELQEFKFLRRSLISRIPAIGAYISIAVNDCIFNEDAFEKWLREKLRQRGRSTFADFEVCGGSGTHNTNFTLNILCVDTTEKKTLVLPSDITSYVGHEDPRDLDVAFAKGAPSLLRPTVLSRPVTTAVPWGPLNWKWWFSNSNSTIAEIPCTDYGVPIEWGAMPVFSVKVANIPVKVDGSFLCAVFVGLAILRNSRESILRNNRESNLIQMDGWMMLGNQYWEQLFEKGKDIGRRALPDLTIEQPRKRKNKMENMGMNFSPATRKIVKRRKGLTGSSDGVIVNNLQ